MTILIPCTCVHEQFNYVYMCTRGGVFSSLYLLYQYSCNNFFPLQEQKQREEEEEAYSDDHEDDDDDATLSADEIAAGKSG